MVTITIKENSKQAKAIIEMLRTFSFVEIHEKSNYNADFVKKITKARKEKGGKKVTADNLWENIK